jgi:predicted RecB family nuclease
MYIKESLWSFNTRDLMRASSCHHCTLISVARTLGIEDVLAKLKPYEDELAEAKLLGEDTSLAQKYGLIFEEALIAELLANVGAEIVRRPTIDGDVEETISLMEAGTPIVYQGGLKREFEGTLFSGRPDFIVHQDWELVFVDGKLSGQKRSDSGINKYSAWDAKYGGNAKPAYLLQIGLYVDALEAIGFKAEGARHGLILGYRAMETFEEIEIVPAMRLARQKIVSIVAEAKAASKNGHLEDFSAQSLTWHCPSKVNCEICEYPNLCNDDRLATDDLVQVANITQSQISKLVTAGITTMHQLASATDSQRPARLTEETFEKVRRQAKAQVHSLSTGEAHHVLLDDPMLQFLPPRSELDIFFDFEGFPYFTERGGLEYLFGNYVWGEGKNEGVALDDLFTEFWAHNREQEKEAFSKFMVWALDRMNRDPNAHIYHYASYEVTALKRLAQRHGVYEQEVSWLIATERLVDMYNIVRNSLVVGEESYSIKKLERHYKFKRSSDVTKASASIDEYDRWRELDGLAKDPKIDAAERLKIQAEADKVYAELRLYNLEDVWSTRELYRWLEGMSGACSRYGTDREGDQDEEDGDRALSKSEIELAELRAQTQELFDKVDNWDWGKDVEADYRASIWLALTHSILFYKREDVMFWADIAIKVLMDDEALSQDRTAAAISDVVEISREIKTGRDGNQKLVLTYTAKLADDDFYIPKTGARIIARYRSEGKKQNRDYGEITEISGSEITFIRRVRKGSEKYTPDAIIDVTNFPTTAKQRELRELANSIAKIWGSPHNPSPSGPAIMDLLMRRTPKFRTLESLPKPDPDNYLPAILLAVDDLNESVLAIQGPPGSGKTYLASRAIAHLIASGKSVAVTATSHSAIDNVLEACVEAGVPVNAIMKVQKDTPAQAWSIKDTGPAATWLKKQSGGFLIAGTSFFFSNDKVRENQVDYLFVDEAAQYSLVDCMAVSGFAKNLVLLGDPQQLAQVVLAVHPGGVENSALGHYMGNYSILPNNMGYFIEVTRRLHPEVNHAVSWLAYEGKLRSHSSTLKHKIDGHQQGLITVPVPHTGNSTSSEEEAETVIDLVRSLNAEPDPSNVLIVAAYNAQVDLIRHHLDDAGFEQVMVGTVDKFQGREGMAVIYSFAASSSMDAPRGLEFLLDRNRLNVAISRAKATCYLVFSETLLQSQFRTVEEVKAISRLAGLLEIAAK